MRFNIFSKNRNRTFKKIAKAKVLIVSRIANDEFYQNHINCNQCEAYKKTN